MTWIKICGITNVEDALNAASLGVNALGFIFAPSLRRVNPDIAQKIIRTLPNSLSKVGVFVNEDPEEVLRVAEYCSLNGLQFHGDESGDYCQKFFLPVIKTIRIRNVESLKNMAEYPHASILLDTFHPVKFGGTGKSFPWEVAIKAKEERNFILSGGLNPSNVGEAVKRVRPSGVDVCSGVESAPGKKDLSRMIEFVKEVREADETA